MKIHRKYMLSLHISIKKYDFQLMFIEKSNMPSIFSSQSATWEWLPTSSAPTTLKSQMPTTRNQQHQKKTNTPLSLDIGSSLHQLRKFWVMCLAQTAVGILVKKKTKTSFPSKSPPCNLYKPLSLSIQFMETKICQLHSISECLAKPRPQWSWPANSPSRSSCSKASSRPASRF